MKKNLLILLAGTIMSSPACTKLGNLDNGVQTTARMCPILGMESIATVNLGVPTTRIAFLYNAQGNPVEIENTTSRKSEPFGPEYYFRYDRFNRLADFIMGAHALTLSNTITKSIPTSQMKCGDSFMKTTV